MNKLVKSRSAAPEDDKVVWPSLSTYIGALRRQFLIALLFTLPVFGVMVFTVSKWGPDYTSSATVLFDISKLRGPEQESTLVLANRAAGQFTSRFAAADFQIALHQRWEEQGIEKPYARPSGMKDKVGKYIPERFWPGSWTMSDEEQIRKWRTGHVAAALELMTLPGQFALTVKAHASKPEDAQIMAREALNYYVEEDLVRHKAVLEAQLKNLKSLEDSTLQEKASPSDLAPPMLSTEELSEAEKKNLKSREQLLVGQVISKQKELVRAQQIQYDREFALQNELNALLSKRGQSHPEVIQKRSEIDKFKAAGGGVVLDNELTKMKNELNTLQLTMRSHGIPIDRSVQISGFSDEVRRYLLDVSNQIRGIELEIDSIEQQQADPKKWSRYQLVKEAEFSNKPANTDRIFLTIGIGLMLAAFVFLLVVVVREIWSPWIADRALFLRAYDIPVLLEAPHSKRMPFLGVTEIRKLRAELGQLTGKSKKDLRTLDAYRYLLEMLKAKGNPQVMSFFDLGLDKHSGSAAANLANVMATDSNERVILLSFHPAGQKHLPQKATRDLMEFLAGECEWKDCRIKADGEMACDVAIAARPELQLGHFREDLVQRLIKALREKYQRIIIDGLNPMFVNENGMLGRESDLILIRMKLGATRKADLDRILVVTPEEKVQGAVFT